MRNAPEAVAKRGYVRTDGCTTWLTAWVTDDTGEVMVTIRAEDYLRLGHPIVVRGISPERLYAFKGTIWRKDDFTGLGVDAVRVFE